MAFLFDFGKSRICPTEARTVYSPFKYFSIVLAFEGDSHVEWFEGSGQENRRNQGRLFRCRRRRHFLPESVVRPGRQARKYYRLRLQGRDLRWPPGWHGCHQGPLRPGNRQAHPGRRHGRR